MALPDTQGVNGVPITKEDSRSERNTKGIVSEREEEVQLDPSEDCTGQCSATTTLHRADLTRTMSAASIEISFADGDPKVRLGENKRVVHAVFYHRHAKKYGVQIACIGEHRPFLQ